MMRTPIPRTTPRGRLVGLAVALLAVALAASGCGVSLQSLPKPGADTAHTYPVHATFANVLNLPANAQVRDGSRVVGVVGTMTAESYRAEVELRIKDSYHMPVGTTAEVRFDNPLGDQYVELTEPEHPGGGVVPPGGHLSLAETDAAPTIADTLGAFATVLNGGGVGNIQTIAHELNEMFRGNEPEITDLMHKLDTAATDLAGGLGPIDDALDALALLSKRLNAGGDTLPRALRALSRASGILAGQRTQITQLLTGLVAFGKQGNQVIARSGKQTVKAIKSLVPVVRQIVAADKLITPALSNLRALEAQVPEVVTRGGYVKLAASVPVPVSSAPSGVGAGSARAAARPPVNSAVNSLMTALGPLHADRGAGQGAGQGAGRPGEGSPR